MKKFRLFDECFSATYTSFQGAVYYDSVLYTVVLLQQQGEAKKFTGVAKNIQYSIRSI
jgi:hypothetical protein